MIARTKIPFVIALIVILIIGASLVAMSIVLANGVHNPTSFLLPEILPRRLIKTIPGVEIEINRIIDSKESFIHIDLKRMEVFLYEDGNIKNRLPVLRRGNPNNWGGTPLGKYSVITKNPSSFSNNAKVYMPQAIHFYGAYFIHGEPYYPDGKKLISYYSGGCVQLLNKNATIVYNFSKVGMPVIVTDGLNSPQEYVSKNKAPFPKIAAKAYLVSDLDSGIIISAKNINEQLPIASLTKLMTGVVVSENANLENRVIVTKEALRGYGNTAGLDLGSRFRLVDLFYPLVTESSNDAAEVLASYLKREKTITLLNEKTTHLLMDKTKFFDPSGLDLNNVSTVKDIYRLIRYVVDVRPPIMAITKGGRQTSLGVTPFPILKNKNIFYDSSGFIGGKTGYLPEAGYNGVFIFKFENQGDERRIAIIILGANNYLGGEDSLKEEVERIIGWLEERYSITI